MSDDDGRLVELEDVRSAKRAQGFVDDARRALKTRPSMLADGKGSAERGVESMSLLTEAFHVLVGRPGVRPWDVEQLHAYALSGGATESMRHAIRFVLDVWNNQAIDVLDEEADGDLGHFRSVEALAGWDAGNRAAFVAWASDPWWP